jgi:hypothetical protein
MTSSLEGIGQTVVIPALAERRSLFRTLASIAANPPHDLRRTLVICVVNNHRSPLARDGEIRDNQETLRMLQSLVFGGQPLDPRSWEEDGDMERITGSDLRLAYIDASSAGFEIPERDGGVGTARKIGMDASLGVIEHAGKSGGSICCLDADTLVEANYLSAIAGHFGLTGHPGAVTAYAHQESADPQLLTAICCYEIFLRSYVMGLAYAGSPYAYHAIGSTMACTVEGYRAVRGMNRRTAAEDFHFLNKLAKIGEIGVIEETTVFPSPRPSDRVPFGTGQRVQRFLTGQRDEYRIHAPEIFEILREWLACVEEDPQRDAAAILNAARLIHNRLGEYLQQVRFDKAWGGILKNNPDPLQLRRQFHVWFDGLKTLRLIHHLSRTAFPPVPMFAGLADLAGRMGSDCPLVKGDGMPGIADQIRIMEALRSIFPRS